MKRPPQSIAPVDGAVIAREYGLPCVLNTRQATRYFQIGGPIHLDGDSGSVTLLARK